MKPLKYTMAALALIAAASFNSSAQAQVTPTAGDVILGVYDSAATGAVPTSYEVDLGAFSSLGLGTGKTETWNLGTTIASTFSADSSSALEFNIAASASSLAAAGGLASKEIAFTAETLPTLSPSNSSVNTDIAATEVPTLASTGTGILDGTSSTGTKFEAFTVANGTNGSFEGEIVNANNYGLGGSGQILDSFPSTDLLTLFTKTGTGSGDTTANAFGTFQFSTVDGDEILTFDPAAVPEPSAYALGLCALVLFFVLKRRSSVA
jgi:hypothetical protein